MSELGKTKVKAPWVRVEPGQLNLALGYMVSCSNYEVKQYPHFILLTTRH